MKIVAVSNTPLAPTGYGQQIAQLALRAKQDGYDFAVSANYGAPVNMEWNGISIYAEGLIKYANDSGPENIALAVRDGGIGFTLMDVWVAVNDVYHELPLVCWVPVDHDPVPPAVAAWCRKGTNKLIVAMSRHGEQALLKAGVPRERLTYIPHAIDTKVWTPFGPDAREQLRVPKDAHLTIITAMNKGKRKSFPEMLAAWVDFATSHQDAYLYLHTDRYGHLEGLNLLPLLAALNAPADRIRWVNSSQMRAGIPQETLAALMRSSNVLLLASRGEGFGVPVIEAQACGTPVIVNNWTAQPELAFDYSQIVDGQVEWDEIQHAWYKVPSIEQIRDALKANYDLWKAGAVERPLLAARMADYDADYVYRAYWAPLFAKIKSGEINLRGEAPQPQPVNRAARRGKRG